MDLTSFMCITADHGRIGRIAWSNKSDDEMALVLNAAWGNFYWCRWSHWHQMWIPHLVSFLIWDEIEKLKHRLRLNSHPSS
jgi:hypothetical protein